jgi:hypothetical protein
MFLFVAGCGPSKDLTRDKAKDLLDSALVPEQDVNVFLSPSEFIAGKRLGLWGESDPGITFYAFTPTGATYFDDRGLTRYCPSGCVIPLKTPVKPHVIEVTGIADPPFANGNEPVKIVEYTWNYDWSTLPDPLKQLFSNAPEAVNPMSGQPGPWKGHRVLQLYDDGWRVAN